MKTLIVDDDCTSRLFLVGVLKDYGVTDVAVDGNEAIKAVSLALESLSPYDLICLDVIMPGKNGLQILSEIRNRERAREVYPAKVVMITAVSDGNTVLQAIKEQCDHYLAKPIDKRIVLEELRKLALIA
ncbi:MAG: response regulator [Terracidiphilus sp.]